MTGDSTRPRLLATFARSRLALSVAFWSALGAVLCAWPTGGQASPGPSEVEAFVCVAARSWRAAHPRERDLQVARVDVRLSAREPGRAGGIVVAPVALDLGGAQDLIEVRALPAPLRLLHVGGVTSAVWGRTGSAEARYVALALVRRPAASTMPPLVDAPTFAELRRSVRDEALARAGSIGEASLESCTTFAGWAFRVAGPPPYTQQVQRIVRALRGGIERGRSLRPAPSLCAAIQQDAVTERQALIAAVMAAREIGAPAFGFAEAAPDERRSIGVYVDGVGWATLGISRADDRFEVGGPALVALAPIPGEAPGIRDRFWFAGAVAWKAAGARELVELAVAEWGVGAPRGSATTGRSEPLGAVCP